MANPLEVLLRRKAVRWLAMGAVWLLGAPEGAVEPASRAESDRAGVTGVGAWVKLATEPFRGKQDDVCFVSPEVGWYVNGLGRVFGTRDGGMTWEKLVEKPGTFFRCVAFLDERTGFAGNIGPDYFPNVSDATPLYRTRDGGRTWEAAEIGGAAVKGLCALHVVRYLVVDRGVPAERVMLVGVGRVGGPSVMVVSHDLGETWAATDLSGVCGMLLDVKFFNANEGLLAAATDADVAASRGLILRTTDGGRTWSEVYRGGRPYELTWKMSFPTREVGYVTLQSYNPDPAVAERFVLKTEDGGRTWAEVPLVSDARVRQFGVGFVDERVGWVGAVPGGFGTVDGGKTWEWVNMGVAVNNVRVVPGREGEKLVFGIGVELHKLVWRGR